MPAAKKDYTIEQGSVFTKTWIRASGLDINGDPIVIPFPSGTTAALQARESFTSTVKIIDATTANGLLTIDEVNGEITLNLDADDTGALTAKKKLVWDLEIYPASVVANAYRWIQGNFFISPEATK